MVVVVVVIGEGVVNNKKVLFLPIFSLNVSYKVVKVSTYTHPLFYWSLKMIKTVFSSCCNDDDNLILLSSHLLDLFNQPTTITTHRIKPSSSSSLSWSRHKKKKKFVVFSSTKQNKKQHDKIWWLKKGGKKEKEILSFFISICHVVILSWFVLVLVWLFQLRNIK